MQCKRARRVHTVLASHIGNTMRKICGFSLCSYLILLNPNEQLSKAEFLQITSQQEYVEVCIYTLNSSNSKTIQCEKTVLANVFWCFDTLTIFVF